MQKVQKMGIVNTRLIVKQWAKREQIYPVGLHTVENYEKVESVNTKDDPETTSRKWTDKKRTNLLCAFCKKD